VNDTTAGNAAQKCLLSVDFKMTWLVSPLRLQHNSTGCTASLAARILHHHSAMKNQPAPDACFLRCFSGFNRQPAIITLFVPSADKGSPAVSCRQIAAAIQPATAARSFLPDALPLHALPCKARRQQQTANGSSCRTCTPCTSPVPCACLAHTQTCRQHLQTMRDK
jgi:hypothetical protein